MFIAFEGLDGSGSTTQSRLLSERLEKIGRATLVTKEPTDQSPIGRMIRDILQHKWTASAEGLQLLFTADRAEHLNNVIQPALNNDQIVITDRYLLSTLAYGGLAVEMEWLAELNKNFIQPDLTFLFKLSPDECIKRIAGRGSEFELFEKKEKLEKIWENYERAAKEIPNLHMVDASGTTEEVAEVVWGIVKKNLDN